MARTFEELVQELAARVDGGFLATLSADSSNTTTMTIAELLYRLPNSIAASMNWWVYGSSGADTANQGEERRATSWANGETELTLYAPGFTSNPSSGKTYELHPRIQRSRKAAAINSAVGQLGLFYWRDFVDESITTVVPTEGMAVGTNGWEYDLTALIPTLNIQRIKAIEIQVGTSDLMVDAGFPYVDSKPWNPRPYKKVDAVTGDETWILQFGILPPTGRTLRIFGEAFLSRLVEDDDILPVTADSWGESAIEWILDYAAYQLNKETTNKLNAMDSQKARQLEFDRLQDVKNNLLLQAPTKEQIEIAVPGHGDGQYNFGLRSDPGWLGAFRSLH